MLYFIAVWTGLLIVCLTVGCGLLHWLRATALERPSDRAIAATWLGLVALAISLLAISIGIPLSPLVGTGVTLFWLLLALGSPSVRAELSDWRCRLSSRWGLGYGLSAGAIAAFASQQVTWLDTGQYHYGMIRWFAEYGVTPGLALLNEQFGFVSAWFAIAAPFNPAGLDGSGSSVMNGFVLLAATLQVGITLTPIVQQRGRLSDWFLAFFSLAVCLLLTQTSFLSAITVSPSPDIPVALLTVVVAWLILTVNPAKSAQSQTLIGADLLPLVISVGAVSIKLTALPLLPVAAGFYLFKSFTWQRIAWCGLVVSFLLLPLITSGIVISGCPLYPSTFACLDLPWTYSATVTNELAAATHGWGNWFGQPPAGAHRSLWLLQQWLMSNQSSKLVALLICFSTGSVIYLLRCPQGYRDRYRLFWLFALAIAGTIFMMLKAPLFRFGMGYVLLLPILSAATFCYGWAQQELGSQVIHRSALVFKKLTLPLLFLGAFGVIFLSGQSYQTIGDRLFLAPSLPTPPLRVQAKNEITYFISQDKRGQCWSAALPCVMEGRPAIKLRDPTLGLKGGFIKGDSSAKL